MVVSCLLATTAYCCVVARIMNDIASARTDRSKVSDIQRAIVVLHTSHVAMN